MNMLEYVLKEQKVCLDVLKNRENLLKDLLNNNSISNCERIVIYATGSSANAAYSAKLYMQKILKIPVEIQEPSMAKNYELFTLDNTLYFAISQSGTSTSIIDIVKALKDNHAENVYTITSDLESPVTKISPNILDLGIGIETVPFVTLGVTSTVLYLMLISVELAKKFNKLTLDKYQEEMDKITSTVKKIDGVIQQSIDWYEENEEHLIQGKRFVAISYGASYGVAREAETKIAETVRVPIHSHELEEYMHGPYIGMNEKDYILLINPSGKLDKRMKKLKCFLNNHLDSIYEIYLTEDTELSNSALNLNIKMDEELTPLLLLISIHVLSYKLSLEHNVDLTVPAFNDFNEILKSKI